MKLKKTKTRTATYKRAAFSDGTEDLQSLLNLILVRKLAHAKDRQQHLSTENEEFQLINKWEANSGMLFCQFIYYEKGKSQTKITLNDKKEFYTINAEKPEANQAFTEEIFYFAVYENNLVCVQTSSLRARNLERYLYWLFTDATNSLEANDLFQILDQPKEDIYKKVIKNKVKNVSIGTPLHASIINTGSKTEIKTSKYNLTGLPSRILKEILSKYNDINIDTNLDEANLHLTLELKYVRKTSESGQKVIDKIASAMRHLEPEDYNVELDNGVKIKGHEMKITKKISVNYLSSGLVDEKILYRILRDYLNEILNKDK